MKPSLMTIGAVLAALAAPVMAQQFPDKPVRGVLTFPPGSAVDIVARVYLQKLSEHWGQNVLADNRGGAGGTIGANIVAKAAADGYTFLVHSSGHAAAPSMYSSLPYDTLNDFVAIAPLVEQPHVLVVAPGSGIKSISALIAQAKEQPGRINIASAGVGSGTHLNLEKFKVATRINVTHVPYKGSGEVLIDVMGGRVDGYFAPISAAVSNIKAGKVRGVAVTSKKRANILPNVPTVAESGVPNFEFVLWIGVWGPKGVPAAIVNKYAVDIKRIGDDPATREKLAGVGNEPMYLSSAQFDKFVRAEVREIAGLFKAAGIKPQ